MPPRRPEPASGIRLEEIAAACWSTKPQANSVVPVLVDVHIQYMDRSPSSPNQGGAACIHPSATKCTSSSAACQRALQPGEKPLSALMAVARHRAHP